VRVLEESLSIDCQIVVFEGFAGGGYLPIRGDDGVSERIDTLLGSGLLFYFGYRGAILLLLEFTTHDCGCEGGKGS
jgi:hypothetical protein